MWRWTNTQVSDERNASVISERIRESINDLDLSLAITFDYQKKKELWVNVGSNVYIYNYQNDTFYIYDNIEATVFLDIDGVVYYGANGTLEKFGGLNDNGVAITARLELGFTDFGVNELSKNTRAIWIAIRPYTRTSVNPSYATNRFNTGETKVIKPIKYVIFSYDDLDYADWSYATNSNPQVAQRRIRARKYAYIKFIFENAELDEELAILSLKAICETNGFNK